MSREYPENQNEARTKSASCHTTYSLYELFQFLARQKGHTVSSAMNELMKAYVKRELAAYNKDRTLH